MTSYFATRPFCEQRAERDAGAEAEHQLAGGSTRIAEPFPNSARATPAAAAAITGENSQLDAASCMRAADRVAARAALGHARAEHHERAADERAGVARGGSTTEPRCPELRARALARDRPMRAS